MASAAGVVEAIASGCRISGPGTRLLPELLRDRFGSLRVLIVIDNAEHQLEMVCELVVSMLSALTNITVMVTSREPLGIPGEQVWRATSLATPPDVPADDGTALRSLDDHDATRLFLARARAARPNLVVDLATARAISSVCRRLDGMPLAIELAAARIRAMSAVALDERMRESFRLLTGTGRGVVSRQATVEASIRWSHDLLDAVDQAVLRRVAVHVAPFDLDAAEAIGAAAPDGEVPEVGRFDVLDALGRLVDKSLIELDPSSGRYRLLETTRQFAFARLHDHHEVIEVRRRHAAYWSDRAARDATLDLGGPIALDALAPHLPDVLAAFDCWCDDDPDIADALLGATAMTVFGMSHWTALGRACDWLIAERARGPAWPLAAGSSASWPR